MYRFFFLISVFFCFEINSFSQSIDVPANDGSLQDSEILENHGYTVVTKFNKNADSPGAIGDDGSSDLIDLNFPFSFFGETYDHLYININGNVTFTKPLGLYSSVELNSFKMPIIAPFWSDLDLLDSQNSLTNGAIGYKADSNEIKIIWYNVGYYERHSDKKVTFVLTLMSDAASVDGYNVRMCYGEMEFTTGDVSLGGNSSFHGVGFGGYPATVGMALDEFNYYKIGRFDRKSSDSFRGPTYPEGNSVDYDGLNYIENQCFLFNTKDMITYNMGQCRDGKFDFNLSVFTMAIPNEAETISVMCGETILETVEYKHQNYQGKYLLDADGEEHNIYVLYYKGTEVQKKDTVKFTAPQTCCSSVGDILVNGKSFEGSLSVCKNKILNLGYSLDVPLNNAQSEWCFYETQSSTAYEPISGSSFIAEKSGVIKVKLTSEECSSVIELSQTIQVDLCSETACNDCPSKFSPKPGEKYVVGGWVNAPEQLKNSEITTFTGVYIEIRYSDGTSVQCYPKGNIIDGWQRISETIVIPEDASKMTIALKNNSGAKAYFDDIRFHPFNATMKSYVYDPETLRLSAELDDENYATFYDYDEEGALVRVRKETERGVMTIQEARQSTYKTK